jgi:hypothetical protein
LLLSTLRHISRYSINLVVLTSILIFGCGGGGGSSNAPAPNIEWALVTSSSSSSTIASLEGTSWVSNNYYASHCVGLACFDPTRTNDYPGVDVTCVNLTTGVTGNAISYYGPGTNWVHKWSAGVPVVAGSNTIQISAYDPSGKGGSITVEVIPPTPLTVLSTTPQSDAAGVLINTPITAQLSSAIDPMSLYYFQVNGPNGAVAGTRTVNDSTVSFTPSSNLAYNTTYTVTLPTSLKALSGSSLTSDYTWSFTTMGLPVFQVLSTYPAAGATDVPTSLTVTATFNGQIDISYFGPSSFIVSSPTGSHWGYFYSVNGATVAVTGPNQLQANTTYTATLTSTIRDTDGHQLPFDYVWTFKTGN